MKYLDQIKRLMTKSSHDLLTKSQAWFVANLLFAAGFSETQIELVLMGAKQSEIVANKHLDIGLNSLPAPVHKMVRQRLKEYVAIYCDLLECSRPVVGCEVIKG